MFLKVSAMALVACTAHAATATEHPAIRLAEIISNEPSLGHKPGELWAQEGYRGYRESLLCDTIPYLVAYYPHGTSPDNPISQLMISISWDVDGSFTVIDRGPDGTVDFGMDNATSQPHRPYVPNGIDNELITVTPTGDTYKPQWQEKLDIVTSALLTCLEH